MIHGALRKIAGGLKNFGDFCVAFSHAGKKPSAPDPRKAAARRMRESMHSSRGGSTVNSTAERLYAKELSEGYKQPR